MILVLHAPYSVECVIVSVQCERVVCLNGSWVEPCTPFNCQATRAQPPAVATAAVVIDDNSQGLILAERSDIGRVGGRTVW